MRQKHISRPAKAANTPPRFPWVPPIPFWKLDGRAQQKMDEARGIADAYAARHRLPHETVAELVPFFWHLLVRTEDGFLRYTD